MRYSGFLFLIACEAQTPAPVQGRMQEHPQERVQAVAAADSAPLAVAASAPATVPVHQETQKVDREICDRKYTADKGPKVQWPPPGSKASSKGAVWVNLWAAWCKPCVAEIPELREWAKEGEFAMYFVSLDDDQREWKQGAEKLELNALEAPFGSVWLGPGKARSAWLKPIGFLDVPNLPGQVLLDAEHRMRCFRSGAIESSEKDSFLRYMRTL